MLTSNVCRFLLTQQMFSLLAAHCLWPKPYFKALKVISNIYVTIAGQSFDLMDVKINSDWKFNKEKYDADVAVLSLFNPVALSDKIHPICLPPLNSGTNVLVVPGGIIVSILRIISERFSYQSSCVTGRVKFIGNIKRKRTRCGREERRMFPKLPQDRSEPIVENFLRKLAGRRGSFAK